MPTPAPTLTPRFERVLAEGLTARGRTFADARALAADVRRLSDFYLARPGSPTPWEEPFTVPATLAYFMPLNYARLRAVLRELRRFVPAAAVSEIWDFGSGLGTTQWALEEEEWLAPRPFFTREIAREASELHLRLARASNWKPQLAKGQPQPGALAVFSYSFLEMQAQLPALEDFDHWLILEPSTRDCGRALMEWRRRFLDAGFTALAPCTHAADCPLLAHSTRDWCHMRVDFHAPDWWREMESHLPMKNRTLTYSYLLLSRTVANPGWRGATRVIGDTLEERGKTKQLICRGPRREFLSWLHRHGEPPRIPRGALIRDLGEVEAKGDELRVSAPLAWET